MRTFALVLDAGDEAMKALSAFASEHQLGVTHFTAIGAFSRVTVAYFDWETKQYCHVAIAEQVEVLTLAGDITHQDQDREHKVHAHVVVGKSDATAQEGTSSRGTCDPRSRSC